VSKRKYEKGWQIWDLDDFENNVSDFYIVRFGDTYKTLHRSFIMSWQVRTLLLFIKHKRIWTARLIESEVSDEL